MVHASLPAVRTLGTAALALLLAAGTALASSPSTFDIALDERAVRAAGIGFAPIERERGATELSFPGTVVVPPAQLHVVAAPVDGLIEAVEVAPDEQVEAGQTILRMRSPELVAAQRDFISADADAALARDRLRRAESVFAAKALPERDFKVVENDALTTRYRAEERLHALRLMGMTDAEVATLQRTRDFAPTIAITAPKPGVVLSRHASPGTRVVAAEPLFTIARLEPLWVNIQVPSSRVESIEVGSPVSLPAKNASGHVIRIGRSVDPATQSITVVAEIDSRAGTVRPGLAVTVAVRVDPAGEPQWVVPAAAVVRHRDRSWVFVRTPGGVRATAVEVLAENARDASIRADLAASDQIASRGLITLLAELARRDSE